MSTSGVAVAEPWYAPPTPPPPPPKAEDPGFWDQLIVKLRKMGLLGPQAPAIQGEPTADQAAAMGVLARRKNMLKSYTNDDSDIPTQGGQ